MLLLRSINLKSLYIVLCVFMVPVHAHSYFFALSDLFINKKTQQIEIIHQLTAHDLENVIAEQLQIHFSPEHRQYELLIKDYLKQHFYLKNNNKKIVLNWVGFEFKHGKILIYQQSATAHQLSELTITNNLLMDAYPQQINTLNFQDKTIKGSLTFTQSQQIQKMGKILKISTIE